MKDLVVDFEAHGRVLGEFGKVLGGLVRGHDLVALRALELAIRAVLSEVLVFLVDANVAARVLPRALVGARDEVDAAARGGAVAGHVRGQAIGTDVGRAQVALDEAQRAGRLLVLGQVLAQRLGFAVGARHALKPAHIAVLLETAEDDLLALARGAVGALDVQRANLAHDKFADFAHVGESGFLLAVRTATDVVACLRTRGCETERERERRF